ncbi:TPA: fumarylacetoacetate hydrolase family protein [Pseudomonas aeruginosa]|nr:fumarylacetoacetate hydrolase family protein [Pseudomonas aeruginosa]
MKLVTYSKNGQRFIGQLSADEASIQPFDCFAEDGALELIRKSVAGEPLPKLRDETVKVTDVKLEAPLPRPIRNLICVGRNYHEHAKELATTVFKDNDADVKSWPIVFSKLPETVTGPFDLIPLQADVTSQVDYEAELAVVIGKGGKNISKEDAMDHIYGYTVVNDVSARDLQVRHQQWDLGKSLDAFCPMGPWLVTADQLDGRKTRVRCWVNGELRQDGPTENMIFDIPTLIETCSRGITLYPGDVIATGTPAGVGMGFKPPRYLKSGDVVRVEIDGIGAIENRFE